MTLAVDDSSDHVWLLADHTGSINRVVDDGGNVTGDIRYDSFGVITTNDTPASLGIVVGYTGQVFDGETGLYYYNARYYDAPSGRFLSEDPIGFAGGAHLYRYVENNPVNKVDPTGLVAKNSWANSGLGTASALLSGLASRPGSVVGSPAIGTANAILSGLANRRESSFGGAASGLDVARFVLGQSSVSGWDPIPQMDFLVPETTSPHPIISVTPSPDVLARAQYEQQRIANRSIAQSGSVQFNTSAVAAATLATNVVSAVGGFVDSFGAGLGDLGTALFEDAPNQFVVQHVTGQGIELQSQAVRALDGQSYLEGAGTVGIEYTKGVTRYNHAEAIVQYAIDPSAANGARLQQESLATGAMLLLPAKNIVSKRIKGLKGPETRQWVREPGGPSGKPKTYQSSGYNYMADPENIFYRSTEFPKQRLMKGGGSTTNPWQSEPASTAPWEPTPRPGSTSTAPGQGPS